MFKSAESAYIRRKLGERMGWRYILSTFTPLLIVFLIVAILSFSITFIISFSDAIDRMIVLLGSGSLNSYEDIPSSLLPSGSRVDYVKTGEGILYGENGESLSYLKGFDSGYFNGERGEKLKLEADESAKGNTLYISSSLSRSMGLSIGDRLTLLLYENENNRTRPVLMTVKGIFDSGYAQLDKYLAYVDNSLLDGIGSYEVLIPQGVDVDSVRGELAREGYMTSTYKELYSNLYYNVQSSINILYVILVSVALLSAFFSSDIAKVYVERDKRDIASLLMLGMDERRIQKLYSMLTLISVLLASLLGVVFGILISYSTPDIISLISKKNPALFEYYITGFGIRVPFAAILSMVILMLAVSYATLRLSLKRINRANLLVLVENE